MAIGPFPAGTLLPIWTITVLLTTGAAYVLTGATFTGTLKRDDGSTVKTLTAGAFAIVTAASGIMSYTPVAADVDTAGDWTLEVAITISSKPVYFQMPVPITPRKNV